jgi:hypothetical protein
MAKVSLRMFTVDEADAPFYALVEDHIDRHPHCLTVIRVQSDDGTFPQEPYPLDQIIEQLRQMWDDEGNDSLRCFAEHLWHDRGSVQRENLDLRLRLEEWNVPPPCPCGSVSFVVECGCGRTFAWEGWGV